MFVIDFDLGEIAEQLGADMPPDLARRSGV
jgi:hypothetical protein